MFLRSKEGTKACLRQVCDAQHKTDGVQNVGLATAVEPGDGIKEGIKVGNIDTRRIGLEALERDLLYIHPGVLPLPGTHPGWGSSFLLSAIGEILGKIQSCSKSASQVPQHYSSCTPQSIQQDVKDCLSLRLPEGHALPALVLNTAQAQL